MIKVKLNLMDRIFKIYNSYKRILEPELHLIDLFIYLLKKNIYIYFKDKKYVCHKKLNINEINKKHKKLLDY